MREILSPSFSRLCYGYTKDSDQNIFVDEQQAGTVKFIFQEYLKGATLAKLVEELQSRNIPSPSGKACWTRAAIDNLISNIKYVPYIISPEQFLQVQDEKARRSNQVLSEDGFQRKAARYHSQNVLSGLFVCAECGSNYRRITRSSGAVVWRCASRVEHGKEICRHSPTISDEQVVSFLCKALNIPQLDSKLIHKEVDKIFVCSDGTMSLKAKQELTLSFAL